MVTESLGRLPHTQELWRAQGSKKYLRPMKSPWVSATTLQKIPHKRGNRVSWSNCEPEIAPGNSQSQVDKGIFVFRNFMMYSMETGSLWHSLGPLQGAGV
jgi:hypothetical protein